MQAALAIKILSFLPPDFEVDLRFPDAGLETVSTPKPIKPLSEGEMAALPMYPTIPCNKYSCPPGVVCRTPACARLRPKVKEHWQ